ncbi:polyribonucleotide nucleotidyltransferase [bacterium]|jgi:polyribonucleotide nucleotidyltransferase|nr:polyribonucleotide nucleotidyltransferase [bacterium]MBT5015151.1 polyribonucleotide nucleotidyltransferase [bacterium]
MGKKFTLKEQNISVEIGKYAKLADGAAWMQQGETIVLATACTSPTDEFPGFLPLSVDYREQFSAVGKIPGGYLKREGRASDKEVLTSRLIDRALRPLFPAHYFNQLQAIITVCSADTEYEPATLSLLGISLALTISKIPFMGPVGVAQVGRVDGEWVINPTLPQQAESDVKIIVAGIERGVVMVEGAAGEISETDLVDVLFMAHEAIKQQIKWQLDIAKEVGVEKEDLQPNPEWAEWEKLSNAFLTDDRLATIWTAEKVARNEALKKIKVDFLEANKEAIEKDVISEKWVKYVFDGCLKAKVGARIVAVGQRVDGRSFDQVREISGEVGVLPRTHGSALFNRGDTQSLVSATLGSGQDEQRVETLQGDTKRNFMLHYNFPPFSVGEVRPMRGPGRREVGHGALAASALRAVLPTAEEFPYTLRIISDILASNGSSSMATVCGSTLALLDAGVPVKKMVSGIAMGLLQKADGSFQAISDITGFEDAFGLMDFKVAGTAEGITAIQMDIKYKDGLPRSVFEQALAQSNTGRSFILDKMKDVISAPRPELSKFVPKVVQFKINKDKIGAVIGGGGKVIREIIETTGVTIDISDDGTVQIFGQPGPELDKAIGWVKTLAGQIERGAIYNGIVRRIADFGLFVELVPGQDGLVHVSLIPRDRQNQMNVDYPEGSPLVVEVMDYDADTGRIRLRPAADQNQNQDKDKDKDNK